MCRASDSARSVEPTITKKYRRMCLTKNGQEESVGLDGWPPIANSINYCVPWPTRERYFIGASHNNEYLNTQRGRSIMLRS